MTLLSPADSQTTIAQFLRHTGLAPHQSHKLLTLWPLLSDDTPSRAPLYRSLADAAASGSIDVTEVGGGSVPNVRVENRGDTGVLVLFGEQIKGAMQNRTANASFLVGAGDQVVIDVSCVEAGRWEGRRSADAFRSDGEVVSSAIRRKMAEKVRMSREVSPRFDADQHEVWQNVSDRLTSSRTPSQTDSYEDYRHARLNDVREAEAAFRSMPGQVGFVATIADEVVGLEAIGRAEVFQRSFRGLLQAYLIDATDLAASHAHRSPSAPSPRFDDPGDFLAAIAAAPSQSAPSLGLGDDVRLNGNGLAGCALVEGDVVHLTAFPAEVA